MYLDHGSISTGDARWFRNVMCEEKLNQFMIKKKIARDRFQSLLTLKMLRSRTPFSYLYRIDDCLCESCRDVFCRIKTRTTGVFVII